MRKKKKIKRREQDFYLQITSLIDTLVIILIFMLKSYSSSAVNLETVDNLSMPGVKKGIEDGQGVRLIVSRVGIFVDDKQVAAFPIQKGMVKENGKLIAPVYNLLLQHAVQSKKAAMENNVKFEGKLILQADKSVSYKLLKKILYTAGRAGYNDIKFAAIKI